MPKLKTLFETPKKAAITVACALVLLVTLGTASVYAANALAQGSAIGGDAAANFAFADAGVDPASAQRLRVEFDREEGRFVYEVEFTASGAEYEYLIDSEDGSVVKREKKVVSPAPQESRPIGMTPSKTLEEAREIALADAGIAEADAVFTEAELDQDNGLWVYEFKFRAGNSKFEYEINANTGEVYSKSVETYVTPSPAPAQTRAPTPENTPQPSSSQTPEPQPSAGTPSIESHHPDDHDRGSGDQLTGAVSGGIGLDEAKAAALADAGLSADDVSFTKAKLDWEDGIQVYEIEFFTSTHEYEYEIAASTGAVYSRSVEAFRVSGSNQDTPGQSGPGMDTGSSYIGTDQAKSIALDHAGLTESQVMVTKAKLDRDDGQMVYEIEFRQGQVEYEYKIDAQSGAILEHEIDRD